MKGIDFNHTIDRTESSSMKWEKYRGQDVLPMWVADSDFRVADEIIDALKSRADHGIFGYTLVPDRLKTLVVERMARLYRWQIDPDSLVFIPGLVCGLNITARAFGDEAKEVGIPTPIYPPFVSSVNNAGLTACYLPFIEQSGRWMLDWQALEAKADRISLLMLCNPQNPGGTVFRRDELERLAQLAEQYGWIVCSDEIHCDLLLDDLPHIPFASLSDEAAARSCTLMAPSKTWNIAGLGCSFAIIENAQLRARFKRAAQGIVPELNLMAIEAAMAAYEHGQPWLSEQIQYLRDSRDYIEQQVAEIDGIEMLHIEATFLAWIDASGLGLENPAKYFESYGVGFSPGSDFGNDQFIRLNFGCQRALLEEAFARIRRAITDLSD
ncbi:MalY/PatB family protein [Litoribrevibacter euphylliae]|uniref:cysteine-S-conjugate beta-lyase n=1 Tax=Litoribrevibacter euphylliae TaxID=1834034 RepID=A0ABV7HHJ4_9GAMM